MNYLMYNEFYPLFRKKIRSHLTGELRWAEMLFRTEYVVNGNEDILRFRDTVSRHGIEVSVQQIYEDYLDNAQSDRPESLDTFLDITANWLEANYSKRPKDGSPVEPHVVGEVVRENIAFMLVGTEMNRELLDRLPHRNVADMSVIYLNHHEGAERIPWKAFIDHEMMNDAGMTEPELFEAAFANTRRLLDLELLDFGKYIRDRKMQKPRVVNIFGKVLILTGKRRRIADGAVLYPELMEQASEMLGTPDLLLLPLSINEWFVVPPGKEPIASITNEIRRINSNIRYNKVLSDKPYIYETGTGRIRPAEEERDGLNEEPPEQPPLILPVVNALHGYRN